MRNGHCEVALDEVCTLINGRAYKKSELLADGKYRVLRVGNFFSNRSWYYSDLELEPDKYCDEGDLLYAWSASFGPRIWDGEKVIFHYHIWKVEPNEERVDRRFLYYWFDWDAERIKAEQGAGTTMVHVSKRSMEARRLSLPPLAEQRRIVAILDEVFAAIDQVTANTQQNLVSVRELLQPVFSRLLSRISVERLRTCTVVDVAAREKGSIRTGPFGSQLLHGEFVEQGVAVLGIDNAVRNQFSWGERRYITEAKHAELTRYTVRPGDVLITIMGTCGRCAIVPENIPLSINSKHLCCITLDKSQCIPQYLHAYFLYHPVSRGFLAQRAKGSIMEGLNMGIIKKLPLVLPDIVGQRALVDDFARIHESVESLKQVAERKLTALTDLKQSILQKAFRGELTAATAEAELAGAIADE